eukprot:GHVU01077833.1.p1 GENE.GHVU01077833.1~~GHVU01077833.1.p1  ORF type:complete len:119 (+),score=4.86 GHVU01077833.1:414-770(+)
MLSFSLNVSYYAAASTVACAALVARACIMDEELYPILERLTTSKVSIASLVESGRGFFMDTVLFLVVSTPTVQGREASLANLVVFVCGVVCLKIFPIRPFSPRGRVWSHPRPECVTHQ